MIEIDYGRLPDGGIDHSKCGAMGYRCCETCGELIEKAEEELQTLPLSERGFGT